MSGLGRIHPPYNVDPPLPEDPEKPPPYPIPSQREETMTGLKRYPLVAEPYSYPIYSNTAFGLLGWANVAADIALTAEGGNSNRRPTKTHDQLVARDIFGPLGMDSSFFKIPPALVDRIAIPKTSQETAVSNFLFKPLIPLLISIYLSVTM
jgi:CubicO group peptidase (beta-lactamase class C family)